MQRDPVDDILGYLGLGSPPSKPSVLPLPASRTVVHTVNGNGNLLAEAGEASLWLVANENGEWVELIGSFPTLRMSRSKAKLLTSIRGDVRKWADGGTPTVQMRDLAINVVQRFGTPQLEVRYRTWKPIRLTREQARSAIRFNDAIATFSTS